MTLTTHTEDDRITLEWPADHAFLPVARLVLGGIGARSELHVDRVDELGLALDELARHPAAADTLTLDVSVAPGRLRLTVGSFVRNPLDDSTTSRVVESLSNGCSASVAQEGYVVTLMFETVAASR